MLVSTETDAPLAYGIYSYMQTAAGRGPGAALSMIGVLIIYIRYLFSQTIIDKRYKKTGETEMGNIINIKNINVSYGKNHVLKNVNIDNREDFFTFLGPSGCGKQHY